MPAFYKQRANNAELLVASQVSLIAIRLHEGREITKAPADLTRRGAEKNEIVGRFKRGAGREGAFHLSRTPFILE